jgi:hypothetical protein
LPFACLRCKCNLIMFITGSQWVRTCLAVLIGDENHLMRTTQVLIGHQIWESDWFSHFVKGLVLMAKFLKK